MANNQEAAQVSSLPLPPMQYVNLYTDENVKMKRVPRPPPPIHDTYNMFGNAFNADDTIIRPLESQVSHKIKVVTKVLIKELCIMLFLFVGL